MSSIKENAEQIRLQAQALFESQTEYLKLWTFKVSMKSITLLIAIFALGLFLLMMLLFLSVALALYLGTRLESNALGFVSVGGMYFLLTVAAILLRKQIHRPILKAFSDIFFGD